MAIDRRDRYFEPPERRNALQVRQVGKMSRSKPNPSREEPVISFTSYGFFVRFLNRKCPIIEKRYSKRPLERAFSCEQ
jgi:hypothetical protein